MFRIATLAGLMLAALSLAAFADKDKDDKKEEKKDKDKPKAKVYKTPQDAFDAFVAADDKKDYKTLVAVLAPQAQKDTAAGLALLVAADRPGLEDSKEKETQEILKLFAPIYKVMDKHGLTRKALKDVKKTKDKKELEKAKKIIQPLLEDPAAFIIEMLTELDKLGGPKEKDKEKDKLTDLKIDGDKAKGTIVSTTKTKDKEDKVKKEPVEFVKIDGSWRIIPSFDSPEDEEKDKK